jgi:hypothetical protein
MSFFFHQAVLNELRHASTVFLQKHWIGTVAAEALAIESRINR